jgi:hypothetical protein
MEAAFALAEDNAGRSIAAKMAITAITTNNSTKVKALGWRGRSFMKKI